MRARRGAKKQRSVLPLELALELANLDLGGLVLELLVLLVLVLLVLELTLLELTVALSNDDGLMLRGMAITGLLDNHGLVLRRRSTSNNNVLRRRGTVAGRGHTVTGRGHSMARRGHTVSRRRTSHDNTLGRRGVHNTVTAGGPWGGGTPKFKGVKTTCN